MRDSETPVHLTIRFRTVGGNQITRRNRQFHTWRERAVSIRYEVMALLEGQKKQPMNVHH